MSINYSGSFSYAPAPTYDRFNYMNSQERIQFAEEAYNYGARYGEEPLKQPYTYEGLMKMYIDGDILSYFSSAGYVLWFDAYFSVMRSTRKT